MSGTGAVRGELRNEIAIGDPRDVDERRVKCQKSPATAMFDAQKSDKAIFHLTLEDHEFSTKCLFPDIRHLSSFFYPCGGFIYVISPQGHDVCKVGSASDVPIRMAELQCGAWAPLRCSAAVSVASASYVKKIEFGAHRILRSCGYHVTGEWFKVSVPGAIEAVISAAKSLGATIDIPSAIVAMRDEDYRLQIVARKKADRVRLHRRLGID